MNEREQLLDRISRALDRRTLVWFGIRGDDAVPYLRIPQFAASFSVTAALRSGALTEAVALEDLCGRRVDLDRYDIDFDDSDHVASMRRRLLSTLHHLSAVVAYRPSRFLSDIHFASHETCSYLGLFKDRQTAFEHKPWVETSLGKCGVRTLPWLYVADEHRNVIRRDIEQGPCILRPSRTSGGEGIVLVEHSAELDELWPVREDHLVAVAPFFADAIPINVGGCVFRDGTITLHPASVQLIGLPICTKRPFGYCGNDFAAVRDLPPVVVDELTKTTQTVGHWLSRQGYIGAFGVDYLVDEGTVYFTELNARLQGSSAPAAMLSEQLGRSDAILDHLAAGLELKPTTQRTLVEWSLELPDYAHVVVHNTSPEPVVHPGDHLAIAPPARRVDLVPRTGLEVDPGGVLGRLSFNERITSSGFDVIPKVHESVNALTRGLHVSAVETAR